MNSDLDLRRCSNLIAAMRTAIVAVMRAAESRFARVEEQWMWAAAVVVVVAAAAVVVLEANVVVNWVTGAAVVVSGAPVVGHALATSRDFVAVAAQKTVAHFGDVQWVLLLVFDVRLVDCFPAVVEMRAVMTVEGKEVVAQLAVCFLASMFGSHIVDDAESFQCRCHRYPLCRKFLPPLNIHL